jgi:hypothetical protein
MPLQELLVSSPANLPTPAGVSFGPPCTTKDQDIAGWAASQPTMTQALNTGSYIMVIVQTRNTRLWNIGASQYDFKPEEDYIIAAYAVSASIGNPYTPGAVAREWLKSSQAQSERKGYAINADCIKLFQCSDKGCNLTTKGLVTLIKFNMKQGGSHAEATTTAFQNISDGMKFGWRGGKFASPGPQPSPTRQRANAFLADHRAPLPGWTPGVIPQG